MNENNLSNRPPLIIEPKSTAKSAIIWMHGLGADAHDFEGIVPMLPIEQCAIRMVFPNAPLRAVTINGGMVMPAWYDIRDTALRNADVAGIQASHQTIQALVSEQVAAGISAERIVIAGFSQGGAMALHSGLRTPHAIAGIVALSCYVLDREHHQSTVPALHRDTPIWMAHGEYDNVVPYELGKSSADFLHSQQHKVTFVSYPIAHEVSMPEINALSDWLLEVLR